MRYTFAAIFIIMFIYSITMNWRRLKDGVDKVIYIGMALLVLGVLMLYSFKIDIIFPVSNEMVRIMERYLIRGV